MSHEPRHSREIDKFGPTDPLLGRTLAGRYHIVQVLGEGGIGRVYRAEHARLRRPVAVKVLLDEHTRSKEVQQRFEREALTLSALNHPNIVTITDFGSVGDVTYLVMELVDGEELSDILKSGALSPNRALRIMRQLLCSLAYAHEMDVIHRDLKPANVRVRRMADGTDHVEVLDFGLAKFVDGGNATEQLTRTGLVMGTPAYMAPEQASGSNADTRTDVYSAALILFEMLTGRRPFEADEPSELLRAHLLQPPPKLSDVRKGLSVTPELEAFIDKALEKSPGDRFLNGQEMLDAFRALPEHAVRAPEPTQKIERSRDSGFMQSLRPSARASRGEKEQGTSTRLKIIVMLSCVVAIAAGVVGYISAPATGADDEGGAASAATAAPPEKNPTPADAANAKPATSEAETIGTVVAGPTRPLVGSPIRGTLPAPLKSAQARLQRGRGMTARHTRPLERFQRRNPDDVRGTLILGHAYAAQGKPRAAIRTYQQAYDQTDKARGDLRMLRNLLRFARVESLYGPARNALTQIYGTEAIDALDTLLAQTRDGAQKQRLERLRRELARAK